MLTEISLLCQDPSTICASMHVDSLVVTGTCGGAEEEGRGSRCSGKREEEVEEEGGRRDLEQRDGGREDFGGKGEEDGKERDCGRADCEKKESRRRRRRRRRGARTSLRRRALAPSHRRHSPAPHPRGT
eukprot:3284892-Rhodomonas_salina.3